MNVTPFDVRVLEEAGEALMRHGELKLFAGVSALALRMRSELWDHPQHGFSVRVPSRFACGVDESAGMAEVYELRREKA